MLSTKYGKTEQEHIFIQWIMGPVQYSDKNTVYNRHLMVGHRVQQQICDYTSHNEYISLNISLYNEYKANDIYLFSFFIAFF